MTLALRRAVPALLGLALLQAQVFAAAPARPSRDESAGIVPQREIPKAADKPDQVPAPILRLMLKPLKRGMWIRLPVMDTDPNRGITGGVMPIWVIKEENGERIKHIHAPSLTYNDNFKVTPTYRYYLYPADDSALVARGSIGKYEKELMGHYEDSSFAGTAFDTILRVQYNVDAGRRFFGVGPDTPKSAEANYKEDHYHFKLGWGTPLYHESRWRVHVTNRLLAQKIGNGPLKGFTGFSTRFPGLAPEHRKQSNELRLTLDFDSRDHATTPTGGAFVQMFREHSIRGFASSYDFSRTGFDGRYYQPWKTKKRQVSAVGLRFEQLNGRAPFWLLPSLGGKYTLRAYGQGRYIDRSAVAFNAEQRFTVWDVKMAGVTTEFEVAPFVGVGTVADTVDRMAMRYARPVVGVGTRAVARPQVVGSVDFGVGQEGLAVFMDINYSF